MTFGPLRSALSALLLAGLTLFGGASQAQENWATAQARQLTEQGDQHREAKRYEISAARYRQALEIDATFGPAYLKLADLRESSGDRAEAERVLILASEHIPDFLEALTQRAELLIRAGRLREATSVLHAASSRRPDDLALQDRMLMTAPRAGNYPLALAAARRKAHGPDTPAVGRLKAAETASLLGLLLASSDPVLSGCDHAEAARRALCRAAKGPSARKSGQGGR